MAYKIKLYLETTVFNFYFAEKDGIKRQYTHMLFKAIENGKFDVFVSEYVIGEILRDTSIKSKKMRALIDKYVKNTLYVDQRTLNLADLYIKNGIIPLKYLNDARHIALAAVNKLDFIVTFNMGHIVKPKTMVGTGFVNLLYGYRQIGLCTPTEVIEYGQI
ncbi:MAG: hypothetical protein FWD78_12490 [Treponema sp.]|nr:hypothetical protein [Treponema sp.]